MINKTAKPTPKPFGALSALELRLLAMAERAGRKTIETSFAVETLGDPMRASHVLTSLARKGRLLRVVRGRYFTVPLRAPAGAWVPDEAVVARYWMGATPYYLGYYTAYRYWGLTDQIPQETFVLNTAISRRIVVSGLRFRAVKIPPSKFYGVMGLRVDGEEVHMSDRERTLVDYVYRPVGTWSTLLAIMRRASKEFDLGKLIGYGSRFPVATTRKRLGCLLEMAGVSRGRLKPLIHSVLATRTLVSLNPWATSRRGSIDESWRVIRDA